MKGLPPLHQLSNAELIATLSRLAQSERTATAELIASLAEFDRRRLFLDEGYNSLFSYCIQVLRLSEHAAYGRIEAARTAKTFPKVLSMLEDGSITLTTICLLAPHLTQANHVALLEEAQGKRKRDVELIVARLRPQPDVPSVIRKLPTTAPRLNACAPEGRDEAVLSASTGFAAPVAAPPAKPAIIAPFTPERYKLQITVDRDAHDLLRQAQDLMRHAVPNGDPALIVTRALRLLVDDLLRKRAAAVAAPRRSRGVDDGSRAIPASVRRAVWARDQGRCAFEGSRGRCGARGLVEYHHVIPYAMGGTATVDNIELRCRAHNAHEARLAGLDGPKEEAFAQPPARVGMISTMSPSESGCASAPCRISVSLTAKL